MTSTITTVEPVPVDAEDAPWAIVDDPGGAAILHHDFAGGGSLDYWLPRRAIPVDFDGNAATINVDPAEIVRWCTFVDHVKADVVFSAKPDVLLLWFALNLEGVTAVEAAGRVDLIDDDTGVVVGVLPAPFLLDADRTRHDCAWTVGDGYLECDLPDLDPALYLGAVFDPTTIDTATATSPTGVSNQKKLRRLSNGFLVAIVASTSTNAEVWYSTDDGGSWTQYSGADIAGWANGSIYAYVDSPGGVERLVAVWKQTGTGGSPARTSGKIYVAVGTFNSGRTTLTWGTAVDTLTNAVDFDYPDLVAMAEGTGGVARIVSSYTSASENFAPFLRVDIDSSGALTIPTREASAGNFGFGQWGFIGANTGVNVHSNPSIDYDPATKRLFMVRSAGTTGSGKGVRFTTASYSTGVWTWSSEVTVDSTVYVSTPALEGVICLWDGTRAVIGGMVWDGASYHIQIWDAPSPFTTFTERVDTTVAASAALLGFGMAINPGTGDVFLFGSPLSGTYNNVGYRKATRSGTTLTLGSVTTTDTFTGTSAPPAVNALYAADQIRWIYARGSSSPLTAKYDALSLNEPPTAPTWITPAGAKDVGSSLQLQATFNDPNTGDTVSAYALKRDIAGTVRWWDGTDWDATVETWVTHTDLDVTLASGWGVDGGADHGYYIAAKDAAGAAGPYSTVLTVTPSAKVNPTLDEPDDGDTVGTATLNAEWTVAEQTEYQLRLLSAADAELWTSGWVADVSARVRTIGYTLVNGTSYKVELTTKNFDGLTSNVVTNDITVSYTPPGTPTLTFDTDDNLKIGVIIANPAAGGGTPSTVSNDLHRRLFGETGDGIRIATGIAEDGTYDDVYVGHLEDFEYRAEAIAANGTRTFSAWTH